MANLNEIYKCELCGNIVEVVNAKDGKLFCCGQEMVLKIPQTAESSQEKHVPFAETIEGGTRVKIGQNAAHPMEEKHYIEWIEIINGSYVNKKYLKPGDAPYADFYIKQNDNMIIREYCSVHGLWESK